MAIFNSLGSNYSFSFAVRALFARNNPKQKLVLPSYLEKRYGGKITLVYKGRDAIRLALQAIGMPKKYTVGICGYTCYAVYEAITKEGYDVRYLDINEEDLNFSFETVKKMLQTSPSMRILIIQNTLGYPADIIDLVEFCRERGIIIIEDLAHSIGAKYINGAEVGTIGDFTVLSFSQDKMVDSMSGGALVIRNQKYILEGVRLMEISWQQQLRDRFYPLFSYLIRNTYDFGLGKSLQVLLKKLHLLSMPMGHVSSRKIYSLPIWYRTLIYFSFTNLETQLNHRKKIASIYAEKLNPSILSSVLIPQISLSSNLRFPIFVQDREGLIKYLKKQKIFVSDIWYDSPIGPKKYLQLTDYSHQCPISEKVSNLMVNLPTHQNINETTAKYIVQKINAWLDVVIPASAGAAPIKSGLVPLG